MFFEYVLYQLAVLIYSVDLWPCHWLDAERGVAPLVTNKNIHQLQTNREQSIMWKKRLAKSQNISIPSKRYISKNKSDICDVNCCYDRTLHNYELECFWTIADLKSVNNWCVMQCGFPKEDWDNFWHSLVKTMGYRANLMYQHKYWSFSVHCKY